MAKISKKRYNQPGVVILPQYKTMHKCGIFTDEQIREFAKLDVISATVSQIELIEAGIVPKDLNWRP